jgi:hypothetical protein
MGKTVYEDVILCALGRSAMNKTLLVILLTATAATVAVSVIAQDSNLIRLQCDGQSKAWQIGFNARPMEVEEVMMFFDIDPKSGSARARNAVTFAKTFNNESFNLYVFSVSDASFLWYGEGKSQTDPINAVSKIRIDRFSGALELADMLESKVPGKEYIYSKTIEAKCRRLTSRQF